MSLNDLITSDLTDVFLQTDEFAEVVTRRVDGDAGHTETITGLVFQEVSNRDDEKIEGVAYDTQIMLPSTASVTTSDVYIISSKNYRVTKIDQAHFGTQLVYLRRIESRQTEARSAR